MPQRFEIGRDDLWSNAWRVPAPGVGTPTAEHAIDHRPLEHGRKALRGGAV
jgi:hypothetical protein